MDGIHDFTPAEMLDWSREKLMERIDLLQRQRRVWLERIERRETRLAAMHGVVRGAMQSFAQVAQSMYSIADHVLTDAANVSNEADAPAVGER